MKKIGLIILLIMCAKIMNAQILSTDEISECKTVQAVAWNFVMSIVEEDYGLMEKLMAPDYKKDLKNNMLKAGISSYKELFTPKYLHDIVGMRPLLKNGYQLTITQVYPMKHGVYYSDEIYIPYKGWDAISVCFDCEPYELIESVDFQNENQEVIDSTARIILVCIENKWLVVGFK